eukprot:209678-Pelagomonas_calceolata.AAC.4
MGTGLTGFKAKHYPASPAKPHTPFKHQWAHGSLGLKPSITQQVQQSPTPLSSINGHMAHWV